MHKAVLLGLFAVWLAGCVAHPPLRFVGLQPHFEDFLASISYPYQASTERRQRIERAASELPIGTTEPEVVAWLGEPDYKAGVHPGGNEEDEAWHYVHTWEHPIAPGDRGKMLILVLSNKTRPRTVVEVSSSGLGRRALLSFRS